MIIRNYLCTDKPQLLHIYERTWGKEKSEFIKKIWDWKYHDHPHRNGPIFTSLVLEKDGIVIGFIGAFSGRLKIGQQSCEALWLCDLMVDPDHRGRAGFRLMKKMMVDYPALIGQADTGEEDGAIALKLWNKLHNNNVVISRIPLLHKRIKIYQAIQERIGIKSLAWSVDHLWWLYQVYLHGKNQINMNGISVKQINRFTEKEARFLDELTRESQNIPVRDVELMNWRYFDCPGLQYKVLLAYQENVPCGYIILRNVFHNQKKNGRIVDFLVKEGHVSAMQALLKEALQIFRKADTRLISAYGSHNETLANVLTEFGFTTNKDLSSTSLPIIGQCPDQNFYLGSSWHISFGDGDFDMD